MALVFLKRKVQWIEDPLGHRASIWSGPKVRTKTLKQPRLFELKTGNKKSDASDLVSGLKDWLSKGMGKRKADSKIKFSYMRDRLLSFGSSIPVNASWKEVDNGSSAWVPPFTWKTWDQTDTITWECKSFHSNEKWQNSVSVRPSVFSLAKLWLLWKLREWPTEGSSLSAYQRNK